MRALIDEFLTQSDTALADQISIPRGSRCNTRGKGAGIASLANSQRAILKTDPTKAEPIDGRNVTYTRTFDTGNHRDLLIKIQLGGERLCLVQGVFPAA